MPRLSDGTKDKCRLGLTRTFQRESPMTNSSFVRSLIAQAAIEIVPPRIRISLLEDAIFRQEYNLKSDAILLLTDVGVSLLRSTLYDAARKVLSGELGTKVVD